MNYSSILIQGSILSSDVLEKIRTEDIRFQHAKDFLLDQHVSIRDEISLAWSLALSHWNAFRQKRESLSASDTGTSETRQYWMKPLMSILGYELSTAHAEIINGKSYAISHRATNIDQFPVHLVGVNQSLDKRADSGGPRLSPHALVQEYLNQNTREYVYALVSNGKFLRLLRDATKLSRLSYVEFNLEQIMEDGLYAEFALLFRLLHASRMPQKADAGTESIMEFYHQEALALGSRIRERLSLAVETSIKEMANGFLRHSTNEPLRAAIANNQLQAKDYYLYNLRLVYRILFLLVIEERRLIFPTKGNAKLRGIYYEFYSVQRLCKLVEKMVYVEPRKTDLWQSLVTCFALFEQGKYGSQLGIAPLGSGLFAPDALGILGNQRLDNETLLKVLRHLVTFENANGQRLRVNYADLDVEEFGSVYEGLLEYEPLFLEPVTNPVFIFKQGNERSKSGSHYTPEELVKPLIQHSLDYLVQDKLKEKDPEAALLSLKVCDVACGSGHILLSAARRIGFELAKYRSKEDQPTPTVLRAAIRDVIKNCIYGVDLNPLAVELCKVALWLEAHQPGEPLNFLDHHIKCGNAIVGLAHRSEMENGIADEAFKTLPGDDKDIAKTWRDKNVKERKERTAKALQLKAEFEKSTENSVQEAMAEYKTFSQLPETTPEEIERKAKAYKKFIDGKGFTFLKAMADTQVAQFFITKSEANKEYLMTDADYRLILSGYKGWQDRKVAKATAIAHELRFFHWFIEFPEVFSEGGFDCVLGNPPFLGDRKLKEAYGDEFLEWIRYNFTEGATVDLVVYFFLRINTILKVDGFQALISTNTVAQGKAREHGLEKLLSNSNINFAIKSMGWPGKAAVIVSLVSIFKGNWKREKVLNNKKASNIDSYLQDQSNINYYDLARNSDIAFQGSILLGDGFVITKQEANQLIGTNSKNSDIIFNYLNGSDITDKPSGNSNLWVINFDSRDENEARKYVECFEIIEKKVKPIRQRKKIDKNGNELNEFELRMPLPVRWWQHCEKRPKLYGKLRLIDRCIVIAKTSKHFAFCFTSLPKVIDQNLTVIALQDYSAFSIIQSNIHIEFANSNVK